MPQQPPQLTKATLTALPKGQPLTVHFNPASLVYSVENSVAQQSGGPNKVQYVAQFSGKLSMDLQFDTTDTGSDVRTVTNKVAALMQATGTAQAAAANAAPPTANGAPQSAPPKAPPVLKFAWGSYSFQGIMDSFKETIDFFSADGIALRALVSIALSQQDLVFDDSNNTSPPASSGSKVPSSSSDSALSLATRGGDPSAARQLGADNGLDSLRFTGGATLQVNAGVQLNPPTPFVTPPSASAGMGLSLGISVVAGSVMQVGAGVQIGAGVQVGVGVQAGAGVQVGSGIQLGPQFGGSASAGVAATAGAFAGLLSGRAKVSTTGNLNPMQMLPSTVSTNVATFGGATYSLGGAAQSQGSAGLSTDVGAQFNFSDRLTFSSDD
jgi:Contractile injection system tube protein